MDQPFSYVCMWHTGIISVFMLITDELIMALPYAMNGANADFVGEPNRHLHKKFFTTTQKT